ncbi:hypothetical protein [Amycolatopsis sp. NPDC098790]|uniref:hypothetical protein n=1 Tax=Amycolatopsis sp. NPDC098790 TaxID=3363939 RepID=UPI00380EF5B2
MKDDEPTVSDLTDRGRRRRVGGVRFGPPRLAAVAANLNRRAPRGQALLELCQQFVLEPSGPSCSFVAAHLVMNFADAHVRAFEISGGFGSSSVSLAISELPDGCGWLLGDPLGHKPVPLTTETRVVLCAPAELATLQGFVRLDASVLTGRARSRRVHAGCLPQLFEVPTPDGWSVPAAPAVDAARSVSSRQPAVRLCLAVDTEAYSRFSSIEAARSQQRLVAVLEQARKQAGLNEADVDVQQSGDGQFSILPAGVDESVVIPRLVSGLRAALASTNADLNAHARLRLRVALHRGHVAAGVNGWIGGATIAVHRLLDSSPVRAALKSRSDADFALIVSDVVFTDVIADGYGTLEPAHFSVVEASLPEKNFAERAWVYVPQG